MKSMEEIKSIVSWSGLPYKHDVLTYLEEHETMVNMLHGQCWACEYGDPYYPFKCEPFSENAKSIKLTMCRLGEHGEHTLAKMSKRNCEKWKLKHE